MSTDRIREMQFSSTHSISGNIMKRRILLFGSICCFALVTSSAIADETSIAEIEAAVQSYAGAFNARDAKTLANHWATEGVYINRATGEQVVGRDAIGQQFAAMFAEQDLPKLDLASNSIEFVSPNVALERGMATVTAADESVSTTHLQGGIHQAGRQVVARSSHGRE